MKRQNIIPYEPVGRLIEKAGAKRVAQLAKVELAEHLTTYAIDIGKKAAQYAEHAGRKTVTSDDVKLALKFKH